MIEIPQKALTHAGKFHADDVFSAALLKMLNADTEIIRASEVPDDFDGIVFDIGRGRYDHHQENAEVRENEVPYAAFGLLWRDFGKELLLREGCGSEKQAEEEAARFDERFVQPLDNQDNTGCCSQLAGIIGSFNPGWDSERSADECFAEATDFALIILRKKVDSILSVLRAKEVVEKALAASKDKIVVLDNYAPWKMVLVPSEAEFVVYPSQRGGYNAQVIPVDFESEEVKVNFPEEWAGKTEEELQRITGLKTLTFCHKGRFLISADSLDDTIMACKIARNEKE
jgi:uncharacterized UPF0160 family protein